MEKGVKTLMTQKDRLLSENQKLKKELSSIVENHDRLKANFEEVQMRENTENTEVGTLREQLVRRVEASPQYMLVQNEARAVRQENEGLKKTIAELDSKLKKSLEYIRKIQDRDFKYVQQLGALKETSDKLAAQNQELTQANRSLNTTIDQAPDHVRGLAKQNEQLIRETAQMHYNMGVLFTDNQKYDMATKEFERALELDPNDQRAHYNLGYLYAEQFSKPDQATEHFKRFLELDPQSQQAEAVKSYLLEKHTYQGKALEKGSGNPF
jgi:tetratricopeptide (TPR) repeat protein